MYFETIIFGLRSDSYRHLETDKSEARPGLIGSGFGDLGKAGPRRILCKGSGSTLEVMAVVILVVLGKLVRLPTLQQSLGFSVACGLTQFFLDSFPSQKTSFNKTLNIKSTHVPVMSLLFI